MHSIVENVESIFERLLDGENVELYKEGVSSDFESIAHWLFESERPHNWFDGVSELEAQRRKPRQIEYTGKMWVGDHSRNQWLELFIARVTCMRGTKQGLRITMTIGAFRAEGNLLDFPHL